MNGRPQFTPRQILDAGLRAESVNQLDHAAQFFRFLLEHHATAPEADAAREHLNRVSTPLTGEASPPMRSEPRPTGNVAGEAVAAAPMGLERPLRPQPPPPAYTNGHAAGPIAASGSAPPAWADVGPSPFSSVRPQPPQQSATGGGIFPAAYGDDGRTPAFDGRGDYGPSSSQRYDPRGEGPPMPPGALGFQSTGLQSATAQGPATPTAVRLTWPHMHLPPPVSNYLIGRFMAGTMIFFGVLAIVAGFAMIGLTISRGGGLPGLMADLFMPSAAIISGLLLIFAGQAARAVFDGANASRDIVAILRAIADPHAGDPPRH